MDSFTAGGVIMDYVYFSQKRMFKVKMPKLWICFLANTHLFTSQDVVDWSEIMLWIVVMFLISCLNSHSDVTVRVLSLRSSVIHGFVTEPWYSHPVRVFMWARGFECARVARALSFACLVSCWSVVFGSRHSCLEFWSRDGVRTLALHFLSLCECAVSSSLGTAHSCPRGICCVARSSCFYRLRAFMLYLVLCSTQLVYSLAACFHVVMSCVNTWLMSFLISCVFMSCFAHGWWFVCWPCACVSVLCEHVASVLVFCVPRALMSICLDPTHLVTCLLIHFPQLFSLVTLIICSL